MDLDHIAVWVMKKDLVPTGDGPTAVIRIANAPLIAASHESLDVVGPEAEMAVCHGVDVLLHLEACIQIPFCPVELNRAVTQEIHFPCVRAVCSLSTDDGVLLVLDGAKVKQGFVELGQSGQAICAQIHVMEFEFHDVPCVWVLVCLLDHRHHYTVIHWQK